MVARPSVCLCLDFLVSVSYFTCSLVGFRSLSRLSCVSFTCRSFTLITSDILPFDYPLSQSFAAISRTLSVTQYDCSFVGNVPLAKGYGDQPVYHVQWAAASHRPSVVPHLPKKITMMSEEQEVLEEGVV